MRKRKQYKKYLISDFLISAVAWMCFFFFRRVKIDSLVLEMPVSITPDANFYIGITILPLFWVIIFYLSGYYRNVLRKSRVSVFAQSFGSIFIGSIFLFFVVLLDDLSLGYKTYYMSFFGLFLIQFSLIYFTRIILTNSLKRSLRKGNNGFKTIIVGEGREATNVSKTWPAYLGNNIMGIVCKDARKKNQIVNGFKCFGNYELLEELIRTMQLEEVIVAMDRSTEKEIQDVLNMLYRQDVFIRVTPTVAMQLIGSAKMTPIYGTPYMDVAHELMSPFQENLKRIVDIVLSLLVMILLSPVYLYLSLRVKLDSRGPVIYRQERIGKNGRPFHILKFRTMIKDAEAGSPQLTLPDDERITKYGQLMRKYRLDELPQFWNVLKGDMSLVGPRPERQFFIEQIVKAEPNYFFLQKVSPGITSLGMVKYGYADTVEKMLERLKYDMIYLENMSILYDFKILFYTIRTIITGKGV